MAIPPLQENGYLPPGLHVATLDEIWERFGSVSERRSMLFSRLQTFVTLARYVEASRMFVNGSYVTAKTAPGDVDVVIRVGEKFLQLLDQEDERALDLELMFLYQISINQLLIQSNAFSITGFQKELVAFRFGIGINKRT